jgi:fucose permease
MPGSETRQPLSSSRLLNFAAYASFFPIGMVNVILGPLLPALSLRWSLNYSQAGSLFTAQYLASTAGVALSGMVVARWGFRLAMKSGLLLTTGAVALLLAGSKLQGILCIAAIGAGLGLAVPAANLLVSEVNPSRRSAALNILNFCWGAGAIASPFLVAAAVKKVQLPLMLDGMALVMFITALGIALLPSSLEPVSVRSSTTAKRSTKGMLGIDWTHTALPTLAALFFVYVGIENGFGGWIAAYSKSLGNLSLSLAALTPSFFYASLTLGRWLAPLLLRFSNEVRLARAGLLAACVGMAALVFARGLPGVVSSTCLAGLGLSSVYPITIALLSREFGRAAPRVGSVMFTLSNLGGGVLPWLVGVSSTQFQSLKAGLLVPLIGCFTMYVLYRRKWQAAPEQQPT